MLTNGEAAVEGWKRWMASKQRSENTITKWARMLYDFFQFVGQHYEMNSTDHLNWRHVQAWKNDLLKRKTAKGTKLAKSTIDCMMDAVRSYFEYKAKTTMSDAWEHTYRKVCLVEKPDHIYKVAHEDLPMDVVDKMLAAAQGEDRVFLMTLLYTLQRAQIYGLRWDQVDFEKGVISLRVKGDKPVQIPLHPELHEELAQWRSYREEVNVNPEHVFTHGRDPVSKNDFTGNDLHAWKICKRVAAQAGLEENVYPHRFRKTGPTYLARKGVNMKIIQLLLAHSNISTTMDVYNRMNVQDAQREFSKYNLTDRDHVDDRKAVALEVLRSLSKAELMDVLAQAVKG